MKKYFITLLLIGISVCLPIRSYALLEVDENGNPKTRETKEGEVTIMNDVTTEPTEGDNDVGSSDKPLTSSAPDETVTSSDDKPVLYKEDEKAADSSSNARGILYTTQESGESAEDDNKKDNTVLYVTASSLVGITIGGFVIYFVRKKRA